MVGVTIPWRRASRTFSSSHRAWASSLSRRWRISSDVAVSRSRASFTRWVTYATTSGEKTSSKTSRRINASNVSRRTSRPLAQMAGPRSLCAVHP